MRNVRIPRIATVLALFAILVGPSDAAAQYTGRRAGRSVTTVAAILKNPIDGKEVALRGKITGKLGREKYLFSDGTGQISIQLDEDDFPGQRITNQVQVKIYGKVDQNSMETPKINVRGITVLSP